MSELAIINYLTRLEVTRGAVGLRTWLAAANMMKRAGWQPRQSRKTVAAHLSSSLQLMKLQTMLHNVAGGERVVEIGRRFFRSRLPTSTVSSILAFASINDAPLLRASQSYHLSDRGPPAMLLRVPRIDRTAG